MKHPVRPVALTFPIALLALAGCAAVPGAPTATPDAVATPAQWHTPLPHGASVTDLRNWWQSLGDPVLVELISAAQNASPSVASAQSRVLQARATVHSTGAANRPSLDASLSGLRGVSGENTVATSTAQATLQASWELDLFGANRQANAAAQARMQGAQAQWHEARVSVAAEVANLYFNWATCQQILYATRGDASSRAETARVQDLAARAGLVASASVALAQAAAAESNTRATQQQTRCDSTKKALVALTATPEDVLQAQLKAAQAQTAQKAMIGVAQVPAHMLAQRPDVYAAQREVAAASADVGAALAARYPRLVLTGSVGSASSRSALRDADVSTWSIGPVTLTLPLVDGGRRSANQAAAQARYEEAAALYRAKARQAVREVEDALLALQSTESRMNDAQRASAGYARALEAQQAGYRAGTVNLLELEEARRATLASQSAWHALELERAEAWIGLYRALGGGWSLEAEPAPPTR
jgi:NodT family efflux transporter outer membrane factor (OMF) lipoprotein